MAQGAGMSALQLRLAEAERRGAQSRLDLEKVRQPNPRISTSGRDTVQKPCPRADCAMHGLAANNGMLSACLQAVTQPSCDQIVPTALGSS